MAPRTAARGRCGERRRLLYSAPHPTPPHRTPPSSLCKALPQHGHPVSPLFSDHNFYGRDRTAPMNAVVSPVQRNNAAGSRLYPTPPFPLLRIWSCSERDSLASLTTLKTPQSRFRPVCGLAPGPRPRGVAQTVHHRPWDSGSCSFVQAEEGSTWVAKWWCSCNSMCSCVMGCVLACWTLLWS